MLVDRAVGQHDHDQRDAGAEPDELDRADRGDLVGRPDDHRGVLGEVGQQPAGVVQHLLELAVGLVEERPDLLGLPGRSWPGPVSESTKNR